MKFEFDPAKSASNKKKHGIDFEEAKKLWEDEAGYTIPSTHHGEDRKLLIGKVGKKEWTAIFTHRNEKIRLISVRRSRKNEKKLYISRRTR